MGGFHPLANAMGFGDSRAELATHPNRYELFALPNTQDNDLIRLVRAFFNAPLLIIPPIVANHT